MSVWFDILEESHMAQIRLMLPVKGFLNTSEWTAALKVINFRNSWYNWWKNSHFKALCVTISVPYPGCAAHYSSNHMSACFPVSSTVALICPTQLLLNRTDVGVADTFGRKEAQRQDRSSFHHSSVEKIKEDLDTDREGWEVRRRRPKEDAAWPGFHCFFTIWVKKKLKR